MCNSTLKFLDKLQTKADRLERLEKYNPARGKCQKSIPIDVKKKSCKSDGEGKNLASKKFPTLPPIIFLMIHSLLEI